MKTEEKIRIEVKRKIGFFIIFLVLSGITAFPIETELNYLVDNMPESNSTLNNWITDVYNAVKATNNNFPYLAYGTDWLAFAHIVIAVAFIGPLRDPIKNIWVIEFGMIACVMIFPLAFICGSIRGIPFYWQLIDCSFGAIGIVPLMLCHRQIKFLEKLQTKI
jgi:hypothetical protein